MQTDAWGIKVANVEIKHVDLNENMVRAWLEEHHGDIDWHLQISTTEPMRTVLRAAKVHQVDLVALGTNSRTAVELWLLGSVAETVLRTADCDVLVASDL